MAEVISVIVPLTPRSDTDLVSATTPAAYGAIATSWPPDAVTLAETLMHEFQHVKLCGLLDMVPLACSGDQRVYAPWRQDPRPGRPAAGHLRPPGDRPLLAGAAARRDHPDGLLRAQVLFARWRLAMGQTVQTLLETGSLTPAGVRFAERLRARGRQLMSAPVPAEAARIAAEVALDHRLTWQLRHVATDAADVAVLADACRGVNRRPGDALTWVQEDIRQGQFGSCEPLAEHAIPGTATVSDLCAEGVPESARPIACCSTGGEPRVQAYRDEIATARARSLMPGSAWPSPSTNCRRCRPDRYSPPSCRSCSTCTPVWNKVSALIRSTWRPGSHDPDPDSRTPRSVAATRS